MGGHLLYNHPSGLFARLDLNWYQQSNQGYTPDQPGEVFVQMDLFAGYRFGHGRGQLTLGVLNLTDTDYKLNPLTYYSELPRERVFYARLDFRLGK